MNQICYVPNRVVHRIDMINQIRSDTIFFQSESDPIRLVIFQSESDPIRLSNFQSDPIQLANFQSESDPIRLIIFLIRIQSDPIQL